jgi:hypothetical protein
MDLGSIHEVLGSILIGNIVNKKKVSWTNVSHLMARFNIDGKMGKLA